MEQCRRNVSRRNALKLLCAAAGLTIAKGSQAGAVFAQQLPVNREIEPFTGPGPNPHWNSLGPYVSEPQKAPLILLTDRPVQLETPRSYFRGAFTPNDAFYVRWHLSDIPNRVDLAEWRLKIEGNVNRPQTLSLGDLTEKFKLASVTAVNQCSGNSRSRFQPRVPGGQWGNGAMGNAVWTGVWLRELLDAAGVKPGSVQVQFQGLETGQGPKGSGSNVFLKSLELSDSALDAAVVAYLMNGEPLPMLNGFPVRLVVPGYFATYWMKCLTWIRVLSTPDESFWMKTGYRVPDTPRGNTTPEEMKAGGVKTAPISRMPVRSFLISPDGSSKIPTGMNVTLRGIAFSGYGKIVKVEISEDGTKTWREAQLGEDHGAYSFRTWEAQWTPKMPGSYKVAVRATDEKGRVQPTEPVWNPGGYLWNKIEEQEIVVAGGGESR